MSEKIYGWSLKLYPARFRAEYGDAMRQVFRDRLHAERGGLDRLRLWLDVLRDLAVSVPREHRRRATLVSPPGAHRLSEDAVRQMASQGRPISYLCFTMLLGLAIGLAGDAPRWQLLGVYSIVTLMIPMSIRDRLSRRTRLRGFEVILESDRILVKERGNVSRTLLKNEVTKLQEVRQGGRLLGLNVGTGNSRQGIFVSSLLTGYDELQEELSGWATVDRWALPGFTIPKRYLTWAFPIYPAALLVRSPHFLWALAAIVITGLLLLARVSRRKTLGPLPLQLVPLGLAALLAVRVLFTVLARP